MQYTGNVNRFLWYFLIPLLILFYFAFVLWSDKNYVNKPVYEAIEDKKKSIKELSNIHGVILGGSNAWWGLSAKSLSSYTNMTWANLSIPSEGYSDENYALFIAETLTYKQRDDVTLVVYSPASLVTNDYIKRKKNITNLYGKNKISFIPQKSLASYIKDFLGLTNYRSYPVENKYGDFGFDDFPCGPFKATPHEPRRYLNEKYLYVWASLQLERISLLFPNATIFIQVPNGFNDQIMKKNNHVRENLISKLNALLQEKEINRGRSVYLLSQEPFKSSSLMCNDDWHANQEGRELRTKKIYQLMESVI